MGSNAWTSETIFEESVETAGGSLLIRLDMCFSFFLITHTALPCRGAFRTSKI
ncbi:Uncharacterised protein [Mycobacteroides abscessus subsp. abscessus]|nr:Uncharacterised protein [Mycobacteroides abscessus subsp. abscessus]